MNKKNTCIKAFQLCHYCHKNKKIHPDIKNQIITTTSNLFQDNPRRHNIYIKIYVYHKSSISYKEIKQRHYQFEKNYELLKNNLSFLFYPSIFYTFIKLKKWKIFSIFKDKGIDWWQCV